METDTIERSFGANIRKRWNDFTGTPSGDTFATFLTIAAMFGVLFGCAFVIILGSDGLQLLLRSH